MWPQQQLAPSQTPRCLAAQVRGRRAWQAGSRFGDPKLWGGGDVTTPATGPDPATPTGIENPTGKSLWTGRGSACPCSDTTEMGSQTVGLLYAGGFGSPCRTLISPEATLEGTRSPAGHRPWGSGMGCGGSARVQGGFACRILLTGCFISRREGGFAVLDGILMGRQAAGAWEKPALHCLGL